MKRIVSLVPSWTETLIEAGALVVGRTRFCVHPANKIKNIETVGGTKSLDVDKLRSLKPDLIVMDREENTREMFESAGQIAPVLVTHVQSILDLAPALTDLANQLPLPALEEFAGRARQLAVAETSAKSRSNACPGLIKIIKGTPSIKTDFVYLIWKDPWMSVNRETFIASMLERVGFDLERMATANDLRTYPTLETLPPNALILLSSEPYPFAKKTPDLPNPDVALVDGESFSWFGIRAIRFLETLS